MIIGIILMLIVLSNIGSSLEKFIEKMTTNKTYKETVSQEEVKSNEVVY